MATTPPPRSRKVAGDVHDDQLVPDVEARHRLVEEQVARLAVEHRRPDLAEHARQLHALLLAARQFLVEAPGEAVEIDARQRPLGQALARRQSTPERPPIRPSRTISRTVKGKDSVVACGSTARSVAACQRLHASTRRGR